MDFIFARKTDWPSLLRIIFWAVFFLYNASATLPEVQENNLYARAVAGTRVTPVTTIDNDPRFIRDDLPLPTKNGVRIAWITDSTGVIYLPDRSILNTMYADLKFISVHVLKLLEEKRGLKDASIDISPILAVKTIENLSAVAALIETRPQMIVMSLNPTWIFYGYEILSKKAFLNKASALWIKHSETWPWMLMIASPVNHLWALAGQHFKIIRQSTLYKPMFQPPPPEEDGTKKKQSRKKISDTIFWVCSSSTKENCETILIADQKHNMEFVYNEFFKLSDPASNGFAAWSLQNTLDILEKSGIPTLIYTAPASEKIKKDAEAYKKILLINDAISGLRKKYEGTNIRIIDRIPENIQRSATYLNNDNFHIVAPGKLDDFLADEIWHTIQQYHIAEKRNNR